MQVQNHCSVSSKGDYVALCSADGYFKFYFALINSLGSVYEMMNARTKLFPNLSKRHLFIYNYQLDQNEINQSKL